MLENFIKQWDRFSNIGIDKNAPLELIKRIRILNQAALLILIISLPHPILIFVFSQDLIHTILISIVYLLCALVIYLNYLRLYDWSRWICVGGANTILFIFATTVPVATKVSLLFIPLSIIPFALFSSNKLRSILTFFGMSVVFFFLIEMGLAYSFLPATMVPFGAEFLSYTMMSTAFVSIFMVVWVFHRENNKHLNYITDISHKLSRYLAPQIYQEIFFGDRDAKIESYRKPLTIFFSDIVGFTTITENMDADELTQWLNRYLNDMADVALRYGGTVDKYIGDAIMIFFGDPKTLGRREDAIKCVFMAMEMRERAKLLGVDIRIGINSGECTVGNFGSEHRMDYTIVGREANLAARLEASSEPGKILISQSTYDLVHEVIRCETRGSIRVKGIERDIMTYWALDYTKDPPHPLLKPFKSPL